MNIDLIEHKALLGILRQIEEEIAQLKNPFKDDLLAYKKYMELLQKTIHLLNKTINVENSEFKNENFQELTRQVELLEMISEVNLN